MTRVVELWWLGQAGFRLRDPHSGTILFIDPFLSPHEKRNWPAPVEPAALATADAVLCTHEHLDHFDQDALQTAAAIAGSRFQLVVPRPIQDQALKLGLPPERVTGAQPEESINAGAATIHPVPACHGVDVSDAYNFGRELSGGQVRYLGYVVEIGGVSVYHAGDTLLYPDLIDTVRTLAPDLALLPINGRDFFREQEHNIVGTMNGREAVRLAGAIGAKAVVPIHWEMFDHNRGFPGEVAGYLADTPAAATGQHSPNLTLIILSRGGRFLYTPDVGG
jgi:L-ascorbate 6-phosphate lactonase